MSSWDDFDDKEMEVASILLELPSLIIKPKPVVPEWGFRGIRSAINIDNSIPLSPNPNHIVSSQVKTSSSFSDQSESSKPVSHHQHTKFDEDNNSEIKAEAVKSASCDINPINATTRIRFKLPTREKTHGIRIKDDDQKTSGPKAEEDVKVMDYEKKGSISKRAKEAFEGEAAEVVAASKVESREELDNELTLLEDHKRVLVESIQKVKDYLEKQKALNLQLKATKLRLSSKEKSESIR
ncbi:hypothetical protein CCACVL1_03155 [Corchorus capsularis]|uniref:Uncharacterized protein n=1 Tax=Corchorus capsularis TaxID=210143 RepID=A0A1R3K2B4_COCAP|nr:hypothetical protein CCACVL1_03155 [Corchorus capsularis]